MNQIEIGECQFIKTASRETGLPKMVCKCGRDALSIIAKTEPPHCLERAAQAATRKDFRADYGAWLKEHTPRARRLNRPTAAAPLSVHEAWRKAGRVSAEEYKEDPNRGQQPAAAKAPDLFKRADDVLLECGVKPGKTPAELRKLQAAPAAR